MTPPRVVLLGGGFAGVKCARTLRKKLRPSELEVVLFNRENHMVFHPLLAEVAGGSVNPEAVAAPLRQMLPGVICRTEEVERIDPERKVVEYTGYDGRLHELGYDHVILACGSVVNLGLVPGMADHAFPMKTVGDAVTLRAHVMQRLEEAEVCDDPEHRRWLLSTVVVGGGYSGVETAGELNDLAQGSLRYFANIRRDELAVTVVHSRDQLLPEIGSSLRDFARRKMEKAGIRIELQAKVTAATGEGVLLKDGRLLRAGTVVCTIGNTASPVVERFDGEKERGRLCTEPDMRLVGQDSIWAVGDCARIPNAVDGEPSPPTGQFAERQGRQAAENVLRALRGEETRPFSFKPLGQLCSIGHHSAVAELLGLKVSGVIAWFLWRGIYLMKLPSWSRRVKVGFDWAWQLVFSRDLSHLKTDRTERVARAYLRPGDHVFHQGDPAASFYAIESGEVEVVREQDDDGRPLPEPQVLAVLGPGEFFGEMALVQNSPRTAGVRARTAVEVVVMGKHVFTQISSSMSVLRDLVQETVQRRQGNLWHHLPAAREILDAATAAECAAPAPSRVLAPSNTLEDCLALFAEEGTDLACVVGDDGCLAGVLDPSDLFRALETGASRTTAVSAFLEQDPPCARADESAFLAAARMRERDLEFLPVLSAEGCLVGVVSAEELVGRVLRGLPEKQAAPGA